MGALVIPHLSDEVRASLERRAAEHGRSVEAEATAILADALDDDLRRRVAEVQAWFRALRPADAGKSLVDEFLEEKRRDALSE